VRNDVFDAETKRERQIRRKRKIKQRENEDIRTRHIKRQKKKRKRRIFFRAFLLLFLLFSVCAIIMFMTPWFNIATIEVSGNSYVSADAITAQSEIYEGANTFKISTSYANEQIAKMPYIKSVNVERRLPNKIVIEVVESHAVAYFEYFGGYALIDEDARALEIVYEAPKDCIQIVGCELKYFSPGSKISIDSQEKFDIILLYIGELEKTEFCRSVNLLDVTNMVDVKFKFENRLTVFCGESKNLDRKLLTFTEIAYNQLSPNARGEIDLRIDSKAYYRP